MSIDRILLAAAVMITAAVVAGAVAKRVNLGSTVAMLVVGIALGPHSPWPLLTGHVEDLQAFGEIGVILLLFLVGLDTQPRRLSTMRRLAFGLGSAQYLLTTAAIVGLLMAIAGLHWQAALIVALGLAMTSDAVAIQSLEDHAETASPLGRAVTAVVIYQGFAAIPVLAMIPVLAAPGQDPTPPLYKVLEVGAAIGAVYFAARHALPNILAFAARRYGVETFNLIVIAAIFAAAWVMDTVGLSSALGAFMVGMLLSTSIFADQIRASVSPLKGQLLAVFFIAIGMSIDLREVVALGGALLHYLSALVLLKVAVAIALALAFRLGVRTSILAGLLLAPFDEMAYLIFTSAYTGGLLPDRVYALGLLMISFSFVISPVLINLGYTLSARFTREPTADMPLEAISGSTRGHVIVVGYSYVGRVVCMILARAGIPYVAFDVSLERLADARKWKHNVHYGDVTNPAMMGALAIANARAVIVTTRDYSAVKRVTGNLRAFYPRVKVMTAVPYLFQRDELRRMGAKYVVALTPEGTLSLGKLVLVELGSRQDEIEAIIDSFRAGDYAPMRNAGDDTRKSGAETARGHASRAGDRSPTSSSDAGRDDAPEAGTRERT